MIDFIALTSTRIIFVDKTFLSKNSAVISIPYSKIEEIAVEKGGTFALSSTVAITTKGGTHELKFIKGADVLGFYKKLSQRICS